MPELFADLLISVDGSALGTRSPGYFGYDGPDLRRWIADEQERPHRDVMGRKTYELLAGLPEELQDDSWQVMSESPVLVFSRTLGEVRWPGVEVSTGDAVEEVRRLKQGSGPALRTEGSLSLVRQLLAAGLVDHLRLMVFPLVLGESGAEPLFEGLGDVELRLQEQSVLDDRILLVDYRPGGLPPYA